jgi:glutaminase
MAVVTIQKYATEPYSGSRNIAPYMQAPVRNSAAEDAPTERTRSSRTLTRAGALIIRAQAASGKRGIGSKLGRPDTIAPAEPGQRVEVGQLAIQRMKMDHDPLTGDHPETERVSTGELPSDTEVQALISAGYERYRHLDEGAVADYIPALAAASPSAFGVSVAGVRGRVFSVGDADQEFAIESISKLFVFALVCQALGHEQARRKLGVNSTGLPFNSVMAIELNADRTMNPLVNAGAMATTSLVPGTTADEKFENIVAAMSRFAGRRLVMDDDVYNSEAATNDRNRGIAHLLDGYGRMYCDPDLATDVYTRQCSLRVSARDLAVMGATLANGGVNPVTGEQAIDTPYCKRVLAVLATAGLYEHSGQWLYDVGLPGKSGVAGGIVTVSPGKGGMGTFSPPLDAAGNSVRGQHVTRYLSEALGLNLFASAPIA